MNQASTHRALNVRSRVGLKAVRVSHRHAGWVVVHDAVASKYHRLREDEYYLLTLLDGDCSLNDLRDHYQDRYPNRRVKTNQINSLLFRFHESGLTTSAAAAQADPLLERADKDRRQKIVAVASQWLFLRLPGVDPRPMMRVLLPLVRPWLSWWGIAVMGILIVSALAIMTVNHARFFAEMPAATEWLTMQNAMILACVVAATKIAHELGHAVVSERFGARCRSIGPMLLVFTPALYCDTSGSWLIASRWKRAAVAMAGIGTEVLIASVAAWVWTMTPTGLTHTIASHVMIVCGVSTILFNANPLLRYDGYYLLSDLTDMPNLASRGQRRWGRMLSNVFLGVRQDGPSGEAADDSWWLLAYAAMALAYRWLLMFTIIGFIWISLRPYGLEMVGQLAAVVALASMAIAGITPLRRFLKNPSNRQKIRMRRGLVWCVVLVAMGYAATIPLPRHVTDVVRFVPADERRVHLKTGGVLERLNVRPGQRVRAGDTLAVLSNHEMDLQRVEAAGAVADQVARIRSLRASQTLVPEAASQLPAAEALLNELNDRLAAVVRRIEALTVVAPCDGIVMAPQSNPANHSGAALDSDASSMDPDMDRNPAIDRASVRLAAWTGSPTDRENLGCTLDVGTEFLSLAGNSRWHAEAIVRSIDRQHISLNDAVTLISDAAPDQVFRGRVVDVSREKYDSTVDAQRRDHEQAERAVRTPETSYVVAVEIDLAETAALTWVNGSTGKAKIRVRPASVWQRTMETLAGLFRFR